MGTAKSVTVVPLPPTHNQGKHKSEISKPETADAKSLQEICAQVSHRLAGKINALQPEVEAIYVLPADNQSGAYLGPVPGRKSLPTQARLRKKSAMNSIIEFMALIF